LVVAFSKNWMASIKALDDKPMCILNAYYPGQHVPLTHTLNVVDGNNDLKRSAFSSLLSQSSFGHTQNNLTNESFYTLLQRFNRYFEFHEFAKASSIFDKIDDTLRTHHQSKLLTEFNEKLLQSADNCNSEAQGEFLQSLTSSFRPLAPAKSSIHNLIN
jgi:hypothetical protein